MIASSAARLMTPQTMATTPLARMTVEASAIRLMPAATPFRSQRDDPRTTANEMSMPFAPRSCRNSLTDSGIMPATDMLMPSPATAAGRMVAAFGRLTTPSSTANRSWVRSGCAPRAITPPTTVSVALKVCPEKSSNMPSLLKCRCHHSGSAVVDAERPMPSRRIAAAITIGGTGRPA